MFIRAYCGNLICCYFEKIQKVNVQRVMYRTYIVHAPALIMGFEIEDVDNEMFLVRALERLGCKVIDQDEPH